MKAKKIWANLTVKDPIRSAAFYTRLGFKPNGGPATAELASFLFGESEFVIHFFKEATQPGMEGIETGSGKSNEIMFSLSADAKEEVDAWPTAVKEAGGTIEKEAARDENGYYYCVFADPDGHRFNVLLMENGM